MFNKILIANRGEIAVRIIRACREMGIRTVAVYSEADRDALHTQLADEAVCIGKAQSSDSYLNMERILSATIATKAEAIHPGFGFLSENSRFVEMCEKCNVAFIGPSAEVISRMGNKSEAKNTMRKAKVPVVPGTKEPVYTVEQALEAVKEIGFPVMIKASAGGGGKGMRVAGNEQEFAKLFETAQQESVHSFSDNTMYLERFVENPRHVEVQILADKYGNVVHLGERDCSVQRRHQKMIEESPCIAISDDLRKKMGETAVRAAKAAGYESAGTIEFLLDQSGEFYFMEMNTRIQVEHPVTEFVSGVDLIKEQICIAAGEPLSVQQKDIEIRGHAMECRINAEDPERHSVEGAKGTSPCFLTMFFRNCSLMLMFLLEEQTQKEVTRIFDHLTELLGIELFQKLFEVILTDNGHEFQDRQSLEYSKNDEVRTRIYYCDPNRSDQKGALEKNHEYIRYVLPKGTSFEKMTDKTTLLLLNHINSEKRDSLNGHSPYEVSRLLLDNRLHKALGLAEIPADEVTLIPALIK